MEQTGLVDKVATLEERVALLEKRVEAAEKARGDSERVSARVLASMGYGSWEQARRDLLKGTDDYPALREYFEGMTDDELRELAEGE